MPVDEVVFLRGLDSDQVKAVIPAKGPGRVPSHLALRAATGVIFPREVVGRALEGHHAVGGH